EVAGWDGCKPPLQCAGVGIERDQGFGEAGGTGPDTVAHARIDRPPSYIDGGRRGHGAPKGWLTGRGHRAVGVRRTELGLRLLPGPGPTYREWHAAAAWAVGVRHAGLLRGAHADVLGERLELPDLCAGGGVERDEGTAHTWVVEMRRLPDVDLAVEDGGGRPDVCPLDARGRVAERGLPHQRPRLRIERVHVCVGAPEVDHAVCDGSGRLDSGEPVAVLGMRIIDVECPQRL